MRRLLASPLHRPLSRWFVLLSWVGPRTGRAHTIPVSYVPEGEHVYATTGDGWWRNASRAEEVGVTLRGRRSSARVIPITDAATSARDHARLFRDHPFFRRLAGIPTSRDGAPDAAAIQRSITAGRTLLRIEVL